MEVSYKNMLVITELARPDQLPVGDAALLASKVEECAPYIGSWGKQEDFWNAISVKDFPHQMVPALPVGDDGLANWILSQLPAPTERSKSVQKAVQSMAKHVDGFLGLAQRDGVIEDATVPLTILRHLFQAASGGLVIVVATYSAELPLSTQSSAFTCGLAAITEASSALRKQLAGKLPGCN